MAVHLLIIQIVVLVFIYNIYDVKMSVAHKFEILENYI